MKIRSFLLLILVFGFSNNSYAETDSGFSFCKDVKSGYITDDNNNRTIIVNYEPSSKHFIFLRCGTDQELKLTKIRQETKCHVYRSASKSDLCVRERRVSRVSSFLNSFLNKKIPTESNTGFSDVVKVTISSLKAENLNPKCLGVSLLKNISSGKNVKASVQSYYEAHADLASFLEISELQEAEGVEPVKKNKFVFEILDKILMGDNGSRRIASEPKKNLSERIFLRGPAYMKSVRDQIKTEIFIDREDNSGFCSKFPNILTSMD